MKLRKIGSFLLALIMCVGMLPLSAMAEGEVSLPEIVYWEDFSQAQATGKINNSGSDRTIATQNGIFVANTSSAYTLENGTLKYTAKASNDYIDLRFSRGSVMEKDLMQDFVLSFKIKPEADNFTAGFTYSGRYEHSESVGTNYNGFAIKNGKLYANSTLASSTAVIPANQWSLVEIAFHYNAEKMPNNPVLGKGAIDSYTIMLNGEALYTAELSYFVKSYDFFRMFRYTNGNFELDDIRVALGSQSLKVFDDNGGVKADSYAQNFSWFDTNENAMENYAYSFAIVGDTQILNMDDYMSRTPGSKLYDTYDAPTNYMATLYDWIVANSDSKNIAHVFGLGDITDDNTNLEWEIAKEQIGKLDGVVPYSLVRGNHDGSDKYNGAFAGNSAYTEQFEGFYTAGKLENSYKRFTVGNTKYLAITLDNGAKDDVLAWAGSIIERYPDHKVIITTHAYLSEDGDTLHSGDADTPSKNGEEYNDGNEMWDKLVSKYENIFLVMSGHIDADYLVCTQSLGENGNTVTQLLVDPQGLDEEVGSTGMVTMLYFSEDGETVSVETYSTVRNQYFAKENQFTISVENEALLEEQNIVKHTFDGKTIDNASGYGAFNTAKNNGGLGMNSGVPASINSAGQLEVNYASATDEFVDLQLYGCGFANTGASPINRNFVLSFDVKLSSPTATYGAINIRDNVENKWVEKVVRIDNGKIHISGANADLSTTEMTHVEIVFNYDPTATNNDSTTGAFTSLTLIVGGKQIGTVAITRTSANLKYINHFRMFRYGTNDETLTLDNLCVDFGKGSRGKEYGTVLHDVDFTGMDNPPVHPDAHYNTGFKLMDDFIPSRGGQSTLKNDILVAKGLTTNSRGFIDWNLGDIGAKLSGQDMTLSMLVRPIGNMSGSFDVGAKGVKQAEIIYDASRNVNTIKIKGASKGYELSNYRFTNIEFMFHYDYAKMAYTKVSLYANGEFVGSTALEAASQITLIRMFDSWEWNSSRGLEIDRATIVTGARSTYQGETVVTEFIGYQTTAIVDDEFHLRLVSVVTDKDLSKYEYMGYNVTATYQINNQTVTMVLPEEIGKCTKVFTAILATEQMTVDTEITAETLGGAYIMAVNCIGLPADCGDIEFTVSTYYKLKGQDTAVTERAFTFTVSPATNANQGGVN